MKILFNDVIQNSNAPAEIKSPALSDIYIFEKDRLEIKFDKPANIDCIGIGNCSENEINIILEEEALILDGGNSSYQEPDLIVDGGNAAELEYSVTYNSNKSRHINIEYGNDGLYLLTKIDAAYKSITVLIHKDGFIGRIAAGKAVNIPTSVAKEPGFNSTAEPRKTLSGQIIPGAGGYNYRTLSLDSRYKIDNGAMGEIQAGYKFIGMGYPFFINLEIEAYKLLFDKIYAAERNQRQMIFEGGISRFLYSRRWEFEEAF